MGKLNGTVLFSSPGSLQNLDFSFYVPTYVCYGVFFTFYFLLASFSIFNDSCGLKSLSSEELTMDPNLSCTERSTFLQVSNKWIHERGNEIRRRCGLKLSDGER